MNSNETVIVGVDGAIRLSADHCARLGWSPKMRVHLLPVEHGVLAQSDDQLLAHVRQDFHGHDLLTELLAERREAVIRGD